MCGGFRGEDIALIAIILGALLYQVVERLCPDMHSCYPGPVRLRKPYQTITTVLHHSPDERRFALQVFGSVLQDYRQITLFAFVILTLYSNRMRTRCTAMRKP